MQKIIKKSAEYGSVICRRGNGMVADIGLIMRNGVEREIGEEEYYLERGMERESGNH